MVCKKFTKTCTPPTCGASSSLSRNPHLLASHSRFGFDGASQPFNRIGVQRLAILVTAELSIDGEHRRAMHRRPDEAGLQARLIAANDASVLLRDQRVHEDVERRSRLAQQIGIARGRL